VAPALDPVGGHPANLKVFEEVAFRTRQRHHEWLAVVLTAPDGRWLYSTEPDDDAPHRKVEETVSFRQTISTGRPAVGDVVRGAHGKWGIPLRAPVVRDGKVIYVVTVVLDPQAIRQTLASLRYPAPWVTAVVNAQGHIVARLPENERSLGILVGAEARAARARGGGGGYRGRTRGGRDIQSFYWVSPTTGWSAHVAVPRSAWEAPLRQLGQTMLAGFVTCLLLAVGLLVFWLRDQEGRRRQALAVEQATRIDALGRLTGGVAHDFNNLLTVIQGNAEILRRRFPGDAQIERPLSSIRAATERAAKLTRQLLVFARGGPAEPSPVDLARKLVDLTGPMSQLVGSGVAIETDIESGLPPISVDPLQLEAALLNLAANARDAMNGWGAMRIRLRRSGQWIALSVRDEGPGFDPAVLSRVFDPFFTTKPVGQGTGLGLSQVYGLVKGAGGRVEAANAASGGGQVTLYFPPVVGPVEPEIRPASEPTAPSMASGLPAVLLVDDNEAVRATTAAYLRECGMSVVEAIDAASALIALDSAAVEAVVSDIIMPGEMDGMSLAQTLKTRWPALPVLLVSGFSERVAEAQTRGFLVINKPYSLPDLEWRLRLLVRPSAIAEV
jgi:signal transduction histidine kinase